MAQYSANDGHDVHQSSQEKVSGLKTRTSTLLGVATSLNPDLSLAYGAVARLLLNKRVVELDLDNPEEIERTVKKAIRAEQRARHARRADRNLAYDRFEDGADALASGFDLGHLIAEAAGCEELKSELEHFLKEVLDNMAEDAPERLEQFIALIRQMGGWGKTWEEHWRALDKAQRKCVQRLCDAVEDAALSVCVRRLKCEGPYQRVYVLLKQCFDPYRREDDDPGADDAEPRKRNVKQRLSEIGQFFAVLMLGNLLGLLREM